MSFFQERTKQLNDLLKSTVFTYQGEEITESEAFYKSFQLLDQLLENRSHVYVIGNGGSAGIAAHHMVDLLNVVKVKAHNLSDNNLLTCFANDYGYPSTYERSLNVMIEPNDVLIAISSSGKSENILNACSVAKDKGAAVLTLSGFLESNPLRALGHLNMWTPARDYGLVESAHFFLLHTIVDGWSSNEISKIDTFQQTTTGQS